MFKKLLFSLSLCLTMLSFNEAKAQIIDNISVPMGALSCTQTTIQVATTQICINYVYNGGNQSISNDTLYLTLDWTNQSPICLGALAFIQEDFVFSSMPAGVNVIYVETFYNGVSQATSTSSITVTSCCDATPAFTQNATQFCTASLDTFRFTNTSTLQIGQEWYVDNVLASSAVDFNVYFANPGVRNIKLKVFGTACSDSTNVDVAVYANPDVNLGPDIESCWGDVEQLSAPTGFPNYTWNFTSANSPFVNVSSTNIYSVIVSNPVGCTDTDSIFVNFNDLPIVDVGSNTTICDGDSFTLDAGSFVSYDWTTGDTTQMITVNNGDIYSVTVTDTLGCENSDGMILSISPKPLVDLGLDTASICMGDSIVFDAGNHSSYLWNTADTSQIITANTSGTYSVVVANSNNCTNSDGIFLEVFELPIIVWTGTASICADTSVILDAGAFAGYTWSDSSTNQTLTLDSTNLSLGDNTLSLSVEDMNGCSTSASAIVTLVDCDTATTGLRLNSFEQLLSLYPNPSMDNINIDLNDSYSNISLSIIDLTGSVQVQQNFENVNQLNIDIESLSKGMYVVHLESNSKHAFLKFIKK